MILLQESCNGVGSIWLVVSNMNPIKSKLIGSICWFFKAQWSFGNSKEIVVTNIQIKRNSLRFFVLWCTECFQLVKGLREKLYKWNKINPQWPHLQRPLSQRQSSRCPLVSPGQWLSNRGQKSWFFYFCRASTQNQSHSTVQQYLTVQQATLSLR